jgi:hypothetical protein
MDRKGRRVTVVRYGEQHGKAKLTALQAIEAFSSKEPAIIFARKWGVATQTIYLIRQGKTWATITGARCG